MYCATPILLNSMINNCYRLCSCRLKTISYLQYILHTHNLSVCLIDSPTPSLFLFLIMQTTAASQMLLLQTYKSAIDLFIQKPVLTPEEVHEAKEQWHAKPLTTSKTMTNQYFDAEVRKNQLIQALSVGTDKILAEIKERFKLNG